MSISPRFRHFRVSWRIRWRCTLSLNRNRWICGWWESWCLFLYSAPRRSMSRESRNLLPLTMPSFSQRFLLLIKFLRLLPKYLSSRTLHQRPFSPKNIYHLRLFISCTVFGCWFWVTRLPNFSCAAPTGDHRCNDRLGAWPSWYYRKRNNWQHRQGCSDPLNFSSCSPAAYIHNEQVLRQGASGPTQFCLVLSGFWSL